MYVTLGVTSSQASQRNATQPAAGQPRVQATEQGLELECCVTTSTLRQKALMQALKHRKKEIGQIAASV